MQIRLVSIALSLFVLAAAITIAERQATAREPGPSPPGIHPSKQADQEYEAASHAWNERLRKAREKIRDLERRADETEMEINRLNNFLRSAEPRSAKTHNQTAAQIADLNNLLRQLRADAAVAQDEADTILAEGAARKFKVESLSRTTSTGEPNPEYFRARMVELQNELLDAELRAQVIELRINDLNRRITINSVTGDNFFIGRLRDELQQAERGLEQARARIDAASRQLKELREQARAAGISLDALK
jgi:chromosome segregation ATPase